MTCKIIWIRYNPEDDEEEEEKCDTDTVKKH